MAVRRFIGTLTLVVAIAWAFAGSGNAAGGDLVASAPAGPSHRAPGDATVSRATVDRALAEVAAAVEESGRPGCGTVTVAVAPTADGRSWSWPGRCHILLDADMVDDGGGRFRYVVRHEVAHLHVGVDHYDPRFRALETRLAGGIGYDLVYHPGEEYPEVVERPKVLPHQGRKSHRSTDPQPLVDNLGTTGRWS